MLKLGINLHVRMLDNMLNMANMSVHLSVLTFVCSLDDDDERVILPELVA